MIDEVKCCICEGDIFDWYVCNNCGINICGCCMSQCKCGSKKVYLWRDDSWRGGK